MQSHGSTYLLPRAPRGDWAKVALAFLALASLLAFASTSCATPEANSQQVAPLASRRVTLVVNNERIEIAHVWLLRSGYASTRLGAVNGLDSRDFDITKLAPVGTAIRIAVVTRSDGVNSTDEFAIMRPGDITIDIEPNQPAPRVYSSR